MLAYRHGFHAGNHADVLKHLVFTEVLDYFGTKDKPYLIIDTHAGAGGHALTGQGTLQGRGGHHAEYVDGIGRLWKADDPPEAIARLLERVRAFNGSGALRRYPGSPALALACRRPNDPVRLFELHPADVEALARRYGSEPQVEVHRSDGFGALRALLPPPSRRAVVLMDPPYELRADYGLVIASVREAIKRFADVALIVWYPQLATLESRQLPQRLKSCATKGWLHVQLTVGPADARGYGLMGSGVFVFNPPWTLHDTLKDCMPWLAEQLAQGDEARWLLEQHAI